MNTIQELLDNNIDLHTAEMMINEYQKRIGAMNGVYRIEDINYDFNIRGKIVTLQCQECGKVIYRTMISGRNKWSELIKTCECQKAKRKECKKAESEKISKMKKTQMIEDALKMEKCSTKETTVKLRLNDTMRNHIEKSAKSKSVSMSEYIRKLIENDMRNK